MEPENACSKVFHWPILETSLFQHTASYSSPFQNDFPILITVSDYLIPSAAHTKTTKDITRSQVAQNLGHQLGWKEAEKVPPEVDRESLHQDHLFMVAALAEQFTKQLYS